MAVGILDVHDVERSRMTLPMHDGSDTTGVTTAGDHAKVAGVELDDVHDLVRLEVQADRVVHLDHGIRIADGTAVRREQVRNPLRTHLDGANAAQFVLGLLVRDAMDREPKNKLNSS